MKQGRRRRDGLARDADSGTLWPMCNNYNLFTNAEAMIQLGFLWEKANRNLPPLSVYPDYVAPIVREMEPGRRTIALARWDCHP